jgi:UDP-N-acetylmuramate--alanine ligase
VIEADEYDGAFLGLIPALAIVTNVEFDHPDKFENMQDVQTSFARFMHRVREG